MLGIGLGVTSIQQGAALVSDPGSGPEGSIAFADFEAGTYDYGSNTFADFLGENEDYGTWDASVSPGIGLVPEAGQQYISLAPALTTELLTSGFTVVANVVITDPTGFVYVEALDLPDWMKEHIAMAGANNTYAHGDVQVFLLDEEDNAVAPGVGAHRFALSISSAGVLCSIDGLDAISSPFTGSFDANHIGIVAYLTTIKDMAFYDEVKTGAELEALSA